MYDEEVRCPKCGSGRLLYNDHTTAYKCLECGNMFAAPAKLSEVLLSLAIFTGAVFTIFKVFSG